MTQTLRPPRDEDAALAASLASRHWPELIDDDFVRRTWTAPGVHVEEDARVGDDVYVLVRALDDEERVWLDLHGGPDQSVLDWAETRARELGGRRVLTGGWSTEQAKLDELRRRGDALVRVSWRMETDLTGAIPLPTWPDRVSVRTIRPGEERAVYEAHQETFRDVWETIEESFDEWSHILLQPPRFVPDLWFLAVDGDEIAGFAICHPHPTSPDLGWVAVLGVRRPWRKRGIGQALLLHALHAFEGRGLARAGLGVDSESPTGAHTLYERAGMKPQGTLAWYQKEV